MSGTPSINGMDSEYLWHGQAVHATWTMNTCHKYNDRQVGGEVDQCRDKRAGGEVIQCRKCRKCRIFAVFIRVGYKRLCPVGYGTVFSNL